MQVREGKECIVTISDEVGAALGPLGTLAREHINLACFAGYGVGGGKAFLHLVAEDADRAATSLKNGGYDCTQLDALLVVAPDRPGLMVDVMKKLANVGVSVEHCYASAVGGGDVLIVLRTTDNVEAASALRS
jgi:hypothetical protein